MKKKEKKITYYSTNIIPYIVVYDPLLGKIPSETGVWQITGVANHFTIKDGVLVFYNNYSGTNFFPLRKDKSKNFSFKVQTSQSSFGQYQLIRFYFLDSDGNEIASFLQNGYSITVNKNGEEIASLSIDYDTRNRFQNLRVEKINDCLYLYSKGNNDELVEPTFRFSIHVTSEIDVLYTTIAAAGAGNSCLKYMEYKEW